jgi:DNA-binding NarL/FixJ family response regulator
VTRGRVVVVEDNAPMRNLLRMHLDCDGFDVVAEGVDAVDGLAKVVEHRPDGVVLDQELPHGPGTRVLPEMRLACPAARIVVFSADALNRDLALDLGANGFVLKGDPLSELSALLDGRSEGLGPTV